jgi:hypothetical protein
LRSRLATWCSCDSLGRAGNDNELSHGDCCLSDGHADRLPHSIPLGAVIGLTTLAMGIRNATVRKVGVPDLTTTVLTLTITGLAADSSLAGGTNPGWRRRVAAVLAMFAGAAVGALMLNRTVTVPLCVCGIMSIAGAWQFADGLFVLMDGIQASRSVCLRPARKLPVRPNEMASVPGHSPDASASAIVLFAIRLCSSVV